MSTCLIGCDHTHFWEWDPSILNRILSKYTIMGMVATDSKNEVFIFESVIKGHRIYKNVWSSRIGEVLGLAHDPENHHNQHAVCLKKVDTSTTVGQIP